MRRITLSLLLLAPAVGTAGDAVSFRNEVMAVLSRAGCNSGACHGNLNGKGGFRLSLRGENADADHLALTRDMLGRRVDRARPGESLLVTKPLMRQPHEGGQRFRKDSLEYRVLERWIAEGATLDAADGPRVTRLDVTPAARVLHEPEDRVQVTVRATFSDGSQRDVTRLACFEPSNLLVRVDGSGLVTRTSHGETTILVRYLDRQAVVRLAFVPARPGFVWKEPPQNNYIDRHVFARLKELRVEPSDVCTDAEFLRRVYLDALGLVPTVEEARRFLADTSADKRERLIREVVDRPEFADFWALKWADLLRNEEKTLDAKGVRLFHGWLRRAVVENKPLNELARELIAARGSSYAQPAANYYRALREPYGRAEATAQVFLGVRLQCAKCHNHPFDRWTQTDYHRFAAFFARVQYRVIENNRKDRLDSHEFDGEQVVWMDRAGELKHPVTGEALVPRLLVGDEVVARVAGAESSKARGGAARGVEDSTPATQSPTDARPPRDRLTVLADWVAAPDNPFFARAQANRVWQHLLGKGVVDPGDDFRDSNPPVNPDLLDALARDLRHHRFDHKHLVRTILASRVYQLSSRPTATNGDDESNFSRGLVRSLQAEPLLDAVARVADVPLDFPGFPDGTRAGQLPGVGAQRRRGRGANDGEKFLAVFGKPVRSLSCECERSEDTTLARAFQLISGPVVHGVLTARDNRLGKLLAADKTNAAIVEELYLAALTRPPSVRERDRTLALIERAPDRRQALEDVLWGLLNSKEFLLRR